MISNALENTSQKKWFKVYHCALGYPAKTVNKVFLTNLFLIIDISCYEIAMEILSLLCLFSLLCARAVNKGRSRPREIAYGKTVDYSLMKISYPFMARLIIDGEKCGGAVIADRYTLKMKGQSRYC